MPGLQRVRLIVNHRFERWYSFQEIILPVVGEADVEANACDFRHEVLGLAQCIESLGPLFAPHVNHTKVRVGSAYLRIRRQNFFEVALRLVQMAPVQRILSCLKKLRGVCPSSR